MEDKKLLLIILLLVALIIINDVIVWLVAREYFEKNVRNITNNYEFYNMDSVENINTGTMPKTNESEGKEDGSR